MSNPKEAAGAKKPQLHLVPPAAEVAMAQVLELGARKYGVANWRQDPIKVCTYISAAKRHLLAILSGEDVDPESGESHWAHVMACGAIVLDAQANGTLIDDRPKRPAGKLNVTMEMVDNLTPGLQRATEVLKSHLCPHCHAPSHGARPCPKRLEDQLVFKPTSDTVAMAGVSITIPANGDGVKRYDHGISSGRDKQIDDADFEAAAGVAGKEIAR